jgi:cytoskeletal protein CcmA (bactofilin family)
LTAEEVLIGPTGRITGRVSAKVIDVRGQLHNTIVSESSLIVRSTGKIVGKIHYSEIEIEKGGEIEGTLSQGAEPASNAPSPAAIPAAPLQAPVTPSAPNQGKPNPGN